MWVFFLAWRLNYMREWATTSKPNIISNKAELFKIWRKDLDIETKCKAKIPSNYNCDI
jgi:hypothetical protein